LRRDGRRPDRGSRSSARCCTGNGLGRAGQRRAGTARCRPSQPLAGQWSRRGCPRRRRGASEIDDVQGEGCSSRRGEGGPSHEAPRGAGPRTATTRASRSMRKRRRDRVSLERVDRSWPVRIARPSCPTARTARTDTGRNKTLTPSRRCSERVMCTHDDAPPREVCEFDSKPSTARDDAPNADKLNRSEVD